MKRTLSTILNFEPTKQIPKSSSRFVHQQFIFTYCFTRMTPLNTLSLLEKCSNMEDLKQIHTQMYKTGLATQVIPATKLIAFCVLPSSGNLAYARKIFDGFTIPNTFMYDIMIKGYATSDKPEEALLFYREMVVKSVPHSGYTFPSVLRACSSSPNLEVTEQIHARIVKTRFGSELHALNSLLHVYAATGCTESAKLLFDRIPERDIVSSNSMINAYVRRGEMGKADELFRDATLKGKINIVTWTTMMSGYVNAGRDREALALFREMQMVGGVEPDRVALTSALSACARLGALEQGDWIVSYVEKNRIRIDPILRCAIIDMYAKCGDMGRALEVFKNAKRKDVSAWTAMIGGFAIHGQGLEALDWFRKMQNEGIEPNRVTFTAILTACSHSGLVNEGKSIFRSMRGVHRLEPSIEHYGCVVDLLGRAGLLDEAREFVEAMPVKPNAAVWGSLLNACMVRENLELGKKIGRLLIEIDPEHGGRYVHLSSIHAVAGEWSQVAKVRNRMRESGVSKIPGSSLISLNGIVHEFFAGDGSHPNMGRIYRAWELVAKRLRQEGYEPTTEGLLLDLEDEEKQLVIQKHSEKLAIAFGLMNGKPGVPIRVFNNLRVCEDCHRAAKLISAIYGRDIILRDRVRFHVFREGKCSCGDFW